MDRAKNEMIQFLLKLIENLKKFKVTHLSKRATIFISTIGTFFVTWTVSITNSHLNYRLNPMILAINSFSPYLLVVKGHLHIFHKFWGIDSSHDKNDRKILHQTERFLRK